MKFSLRTILFSALIFFLTTSVQAQPGIGFKGIGGKLGLVSPSAISSTIGFGVFADLGTIAPNIQLEANIDYWSKSTTSISSFRDIAFGGIARYMFDVNNPALKPFAEGGLSLHFLKSDTDEIDFFGQTANFSASTTKLGFDLGGGLLYQISPQLDLLAELKYRLVSTVNQLTLNAGVVFRLGS